MHKLLFATNNSHKITEIQATIGDQITSDESLWGDVFGAQSHSAAEQKMDHERMLAQLPKDLRQTYRLLMEYSVTEAAELLGIPRTTMSSRLKKLKKFMEDSMGKK